MKIGLYVDISGTKSYYEAIDVTISETYAEQIKGYIAGKILDEISSESRYSQLLEILALLT